MSDPWNESDSPRARHERRAAGMMAGQHPEAKQERTRQFWNATFPDRSHEIIARILGVAAALYAGWWVHTNNWDALWWEIGLAALVAGIGVAVFFTFFRRLTKLVAVVAFIGAAWWLLNRFDIL